MEGATKTTKNGTKKSKSQSRKEKARKEAMFRHLATKLDLSQKQIGLKYNNFMKNYPTGEMTKEEFNENSKTMGIMKKCISESIFRVFDEDNSGTMDFEEFMMASNCSNMSSPEDKLGWIFGVFDEDGSGSIDYDEVIKLVIGLFNMNGKVEDKEVILACVLDIFEVIDIDGDGEISRDEFVNNAMKSGFIKNLMDEQDDSDDEKYIEENEEYGVEIEEDIEDEEDNDEAKEDFN